jgi:hypothetical protein
LETPDRGAVPGVLKISRGENRDSRFVDTSYRFRHPVARPANSFCVEVRDPKGFQKPFGPRYYHSFSKTEFNRVSGTFPIKLPTFFVRSSAAIRFRESRFYGSAGTGCWAAGYHLASWGSIVLLVWGASELSMNFIWHSTLQRSDQHWKVILHGSPKDIQVDVKIAVHQPVTHTDDIVPGNVWKLILCSLGYLVGRFADNLDILDQRQY